MTNNFQNRILADGATDIITNSTTHTIRGAGQLLTNESSFINNGTLIQEGSSALIINPEDTANFVNNNSMQANGTGGITLNDGTFTNNTAINVATGSNLTLTSANTTIVGGDLTTAGTGEIRTTTSTTGATLDNVRLTSGSNLVSNNSNDWRIQNGFVNDGTVSMNSSGSSTDLEFVGSQTTSGNGEIVLSNNFQNRIRASAGAVSTEVLTIGANQVIRGADQIGANSGGIINNGTIRQQGTIALTLDPGTPDFTNNNVLRAEGTGGITLNIGTFNNNTEIEVLAGSNLTFASSDTVVVGGDLTTVGTGDIRTTQSSVGAILDNVRLASGSNIVSNNAQDWRIRNGFVNDGTITMSSLGSSTDLGFIGTQTLSGTGEIVWTDNFQNRIRADGGAASTDVLTIGSGQTIRGAGQIGANSGGIINQGTITADQANIAITLDGGVALFRNQGTIRATGAAGIDISGTADQFVQEAGGLVDVQAASRLDVTGGNYIQTGGQTTVNGIMTTAGFNSTVELQGGRFGGSGTVQFNGAGTHSFNNTSGTLAAGNSPGILTISDGNYVQGAAASFEFELFGAVVGVGHDLLNILNGDADLSGSLDVVADQSFASTLTVGDQFEVVRLESGQSFLSGFFDTLTTNFAGLAFSQLFIGDSLWIEVTQADVPAPGVSRTRGHVGLCCRVGNAVYYASLSPHHSLI